MAASAPSVSVAGIESRGWLRSASFDFHFIVTIALLAIATGALTLARPDLFALFLFLDVWLLGYHHVVSTFTRLVFDRESFEQNRFLVIQLPIIVILGTAAALWLCGNWILPTTYLYWQWFHYTRQSYGIERMYRRQANEKAFIDDYVSTRTLYLLPIFGILYRSWQQPDSFVGMSVYTFPVPTYLVATAGIVATVVTAYWICQQIRAYLQGRLATAHSLYVFSHLAIFFTGYFLIRDITAGWLVLNIWHNAQYILFVWWFNNRRFKDGVDPKSQFLSTISQQQNIVIYMAICVSISTVVYVALREATGTVYQNSAISFTLIAMMVLNFHHYIVDGIIWKRRRMKPKPATA